MSIFRRKKYQTFLEAYGTSEVSGKSGEYTRGVWDGYGDQRDSEECRKYHDCNCNSQDGAGDTGEAMSGMSRELIRKHYWFSGRVQGVGFRYRACHIASSLGVTGWVRNNWDDRVEMEAQGTREELARMVEMLYRQSFIGIEGIEDKVIPVEVESGFYSR